MSETQYEMETTTIEDVGYVVGDEDPYPPGASTERSELAEIIVEACDLPEGTLIESVEMQIESDGATYVSEVEYFAEKD